MCGIVGFIRHDQSNSEAQEIISRMSSSLIHRGPDDEGFYLGNHIVLGHRRLKIIDLETGHQPITNEDGSIVIIFNGEIYNYKELREKLKQGVHKFYTKTDTEVIVHLYEDMGIGCVKELNGIFAFALWDKRADKLFLVRDRLGVKPLHYLNFNGHFVFGSEIKSILKYPVVHRDVDISSLAKYLLYEFVPAPGTIFKNINKLLPAHILVYDHKTKIIKLDKYWQPGFANKFDNMSEEDAVEQLLVILRRVVKKELVSDVPLGLFLSGGIDSSALAFLMAEAGVGKINSFCIGFTEKSFDESRYAREVADYLGLKHREEILNYKMMCQAMPEIVNFMDEPLADASIIPTYLLAKFAKKYVTVILGGDGGDELFAGYDTYQAHRLAKYYNFLPVSLRKFINGAIDYLPVSISNLSLDFKLKKFKCGVNYKPEHRNAIWLGSFGDTQINDLLNNQIKIDKAMLFNDIDMHIAQAKTIKDEVELAQFLDLRFYLQDDILVKTDRASMANSLEVRVPFLNHELVDFVTRLPANLKLNGLQTKYILKRAIKNKVPRKILKRRKKGFGVPVARMIKTDFKSLVNNYLDERRLKKEGFFNAYYVKNILDEHFKGSKDNRKQIWTLLMFQLWLDKHLN